MDLVLDHDSVGRIIEGGSVNHVVFTGSVPAGRKIYAHAAKSLIGCNLELGGKDGAYVAADANLQQAADVLVDGAMYTPDYPLGHLIAFQIEDYFDARQGPMGEEFERICKLGRLTPDAWMRQAVGSPLSAEALLRATGKALQELTAAP